MPRTNLAAVAARSPASPSRVPVGAFQEDEKFNASILHGTRRSTPMAIYTRMDSSKPFDLLVSGK